MYAGTMFTVSVDTRCYLGRTFVNIDTAVDAIISSLTSTFITTHKIRALDVIYTGVGCALVGFIGTCGSLVAFLATACKGVVTVLASVYFGVFSMTWIRVTFVYVDLASRSIETRIAAA